MSRFFGNAILRNRILMDAANGDGGDAGGGKQTPPTTPPAPTPASPNIEALLAKIEALEKRLGSNPPNDKSEPDDDLLKKTRKSKEADDKNKNDAKALEAAISFNLKSEDFLKNNSALLPKDVSEIFAQANKENYGSAIEKDQAIKTAIIQSFFGVQENLDLLTPAVKIQLEDYLKLTKTGKQEQAQRIYDMIFEPALEYARKIKRAQSLQKGHGTGEDDTYKAKLIAGSRKHYLREK